MLYHTLDAGASYERYIRDAEDADDRELAEFFRVLRDEDSRRADYAQELLALRTQTSAGAPAEDTATTRREAETSEEEPRLTRVRQEPAVERGRPEERYGSSPTEREPEEHREEDRGLIEDVKDRLLGTDRPERR